MPAEVARICCTIRGCVPHPREARTLIFQDIQVLVVIYKIVCFLLDLWYIHDSCDFKI